MNHKILLPKLLKRTSLLLIHNLSETHSNGISGCNLFKYQALHTMATSVMERRTSKRLYSNLIAATQHQSSAGMATSALTEDKAYDLVLTLSDKERTALKTAMVKFEAQKLKEGLEGTLAATQWRTRFGSLSKPLPFSNVDPSGSFCTFPKDWFKKKAAEIAKPPTTSDLSKIFFVNAVPFVVFGFLDNFCMIIAGDYIEHALGTFMCISTMVAAGLGNTISDVLGIGSAFYVERFCAFLGLRAPNLSVVQLEMKSSRRASNAGRIIGITIGCLLGMFPLLFLDRFNGAEQKLNTPDNGNST